MAKKNKKYILLDADVASHFIVGQEPLVLPSIFKYDIYMLDKVYDELFHFREKQQHVENLINMGIVKLMAFPENDIQVKREYFRIKKELFMGDGESACLAVIKNDLNNIVGSSNINDIKPYCDQHGITYLTTMDFLCHALATGVLSEQRCDEFIARVLKKSKLPVNCMANFSCKDLSGI